MNRVWVVLAISALGFGCWGNKKDKKREKAKDDTALAAGSERELTRDEALRERPDLGDVPVVARVSAGTKLEIVEMKETWVKVRSKDGQAQGWLPKEALVPLPQLPATSAAEAVAAAGAAPEKATETAPAPAPSPAPAIAPATEEARVVKWNWVRVRKTPDGAVAGRLTEGTSVEVSGHERVKNKEWVRIAAKQGEKTVSGWIAAAALATATKNEPKKSSAGEPAPRKATTKDDSATPRTEDPSDSRPTKKLAKKAGEQTREAASAESRNETIQWATVRLRSAPSTKSKVLADMPHGTKVTVVKKRGEWLKVEAHLAGADATTGWVIAKATKAKDARETESVTSTARTADSESASRAVAWKYVNLRSKPSTTNGKILGKWDKGFAVKVVATDGDWTRVRAATKTTGARVGWVKTAALGGGADAAVEPKADVKRKARAAVPDSDTTTETKRGKATKRAVTLAKSAVATTDPEAAAADDDASDELPPPPRKVATPQPTNAKTKVTLSPQEPSKAAAKLPLPTDSKSPTIGWPVVQVRDEPDGRIVGELKRGVRVAELARDGEWVKVRANDTTGWIVDQAIAKP